MALSAKGRTMRRSQAGQPLACCSLAWRLTQRDKIDLLTGSHLGCYSGWGELTKRPSHDAVKKSMLESYTMPKP